MAKPKAKSALAEVDKDGGFVRSEAMFRNWIKADDPKFKPDANRYHLYISYACPWASRCLAVLRMKGLEDVVGVSIVHPTWARTRPDDAADEHAGWVFRNPGDAPLSNTLGHGKFSADGCIPDPNEGFKTIREIYEKSNDTTGKYSVPVLWDTQEKTIVSNESADIIRMFGWHMNDIAKNPELDLYPEDMREAIEEANAWVYPNINNGVYRCGFAQAQAPYDKAVDDLFGALDKAESILSTQRYIAGDRITEADIRLFVTLIRFDEVYVVYFKTNVKCLREYPNLLNYTRDIYQTPGVKESVNMDHIKVHYFTSHHTLNTYAIVPKGQGMAMWDQPHGRDKQFA